MRERVLVRVHVRACVCICAFIKNGDAFMIVQRFYSMFICTV